MESDSNWEDQMKAYFSHHKGQAAIKSALETYFETNRSQNKTQQQEQSKILSVEFDAVEVLEVCNGLYGRLIEDSYATLVRCHELLNNSKEQFSSEYVSIPVLRYVLFYIDSQKCYTLSVLHSIPSLWNAVNW